MIFARTNKYGIDSKIHLIQRDLQSRLSWFSTNGGNLSTYQIRIYGRLYQNVVEGSTRPENYVSGKDSQRMLNSDKSVVQIAFHVTDRNVNLAYHTASVDIIFTMNVDKTYNNNQFETERALFDAERVIASSPYISSVTGINEYTANVFSDFDIEEGMINDQPPYWVFSFSCGVDYFNDRCKTRASTSTDFTADNNEITVDNNEITVDQLTV